jgi:fructosamine-3-kinase
LDKDWQHISDAIGRAENIAFSIDDVKEVGGGCINSAFVIGNDQHRYFVKTNTPSKLALFVSEADGLEELARANAIRTPRPICWGDTGNRCFLVMEYLHFGRSSTDAQKLLGRQLARLHQVTKAQYGWESDNFIGSTPQPNRWHTDWIEFFVSNRLGYQLKLAADHGIQVALLSKGERLVSRLDGFFKGYQPKPCLLHGDLWSGNYGMDADGQPVVFDPAIYYGDRETDLAMTELFGGFSSEFYDAYQEQWPLDPGYAIRKSLYQLYHVLNHANLFGGGYFSQAENMIEQLLAEVC